MRVVFSFLHICSRPQHKCDNTCIVENKDASAMTDSRSLLKVQCSEERDTILYLFANTHSCERNLYPYALPTLKVS